MGQALTITFTVTRNIHSTAIISNQQSAAAAKQTSMLSICQPALPPHPCSCLLLSILILAEAQPGPQEVPD